MSASKHEEQDHGPVTPYGDDPSTTGEVPTDSAAELADTVDETGPDIALGDQLEAHFDALCSGLQPASTPNESSELNQLRPVVEQLHQLGEFLDSPLSGRSQKEDAATSIEVTTDRIGKFEIREVIGQGGQASAYLAFDSDLRRHVVIKLYHGIRSSGGQETVLQEGRSLARVRSPYVGQCFGCERHEGWPYLVLEYVPGKNLGKILSERKVTVQEALELVAKVAEGLVAVHACGLLHRDIKPSNIIIGDDCVPRLVDFGLASYLGSTALERVSGTLPYMAPEQARGEVERIDPRTDVFSLGAVLYELLTGRPPYQAESREHLLRAVRDGDIVPAIEHKAEIARALNDLCMRCLAKDPTQRFSSAAELRDAIRRYQRRQRWPGIDFVFRFRSRKFRLLIGTAAAVLLAAPTLLVFHFGLGGTRRFNQVASRVSTQAPAGIDDVLPASWPTEQTVTLQNRLLELFEAGNYGEAIAAAREAVRQSQAALGEDHAETVSALRRLAKLLQATGQAEQARAEFDRVLARRKLLLGEAHPLTAESLSDLGELLFVTGDYAAAQPPLQESLEIRKSVLGEQHIDTAKSLLSLAKLHVAVAEQRVALLSSAPKSRSTTPLIPKVERANAPDDGDQEAARSVETRHYDADWDRARELCQSVVSQTIAEPLVTETLEILKNSFSHDMLLADPMQALADCRKAIMWAEQSVALAESRDRTERTAEGIVTLAGLAREAETAMVGRRLRKDFDIKVELAGGQRDLLGRVTLTEGDLVSFRIEVARDAYVGVWSVETGGNVTLLFPNSAEPDHLIRAGEPRAVPGDTGIPIRATVSQGPEYVHVVASTRRWSSAAGERQGPYLAFTMPQDRSRWQEQLRGLVLEPTSLEDGSPSMVAEAIQLYLAQPRSPASQSERRKGVHDDTGIWRRYCSSLARAPHRRENMQ
jgi:serine/threonine protein kinase